METNLQHVADPGQQINENLTNYEKPSDQVLDELIQEDDYSSPDEDLDDSHFDDDEKEDSKSKWFRWQWK